ncbi:hypothetical protein DAI22_01g468251 [Oryza sativa Japonica Group]|nr:hypothetical protein DAI22_01g468251 [Oryza sativa Japonica Group]
MQHHHHLVLLITRSIWPSTFLTVLALPHPWDRRISNGRCGFRKPEQTLAASPSSSNRAAASPSSFTPVRRHCRNSLLFHSLKASTYSSYLAVPPSPLPLARAPPCPLLFIPRARRRCRSFVVLRLPRALIQPLLLCPRSRAGKRVRHVHQ